MLFAAVVQAGKGQGIPDCTAMESLLREAENMQDP